LKRMANVILISMNLEPGRMNCSCSLDGCRILVMRPFFPVSVRYSIRSHFTCASWDWNNSR
jgi:hypothetical protein